MQISHAVDELQIVLGVVVRRGNSKMGNCDSGSSTHRCYPIPAIEQGRRSCRLKSMDRGIEHHVYLPHVTSTKCKLVTPNIASYHCCVGSFLRTISHVKDQSQTVSIGRET